MHTTTTTPTDPLIEDRTDHKRGCGWRQPGGLYLIGGKLAEPCGRLPCPLTVCPTCGAGIKQQRGWQWFEPSQFFAGTPCSGGTEFDCDCPLNRVEDLPRSGLLWLGVTHYKTVRHFTEEADRLGISKRIRCKPDGFTLGQTRVFLAHPTATWRPDNGRPGPGLFATFLPTAIEYVVTGEESTEQLELLRDRGIQPVRVTRIDPEPRLIEQ